jgi:hypothetical protein
MESLTTSQIESIKDQVWIEARTAMTDALVSYGILEKRNDVAGFWAHDVSGNATWLSVYDVLENSRV